MDYDKKRIERLCNKTFNNPPNSRERMQALEKLSETDREKLFDYDMGVLSGRIQKPKQEKESESMNYEEFKKLSDSNESGTMLKLSQFAKRSPELYKQHRERYQQEQDRKQRDHNRKIAGL